jgi:glycosyltransferase involved in cell wall biosynthesis
MKVGLATTWNEPCGIAEYSKNLISSCQDIDFKILGRPYEATSLIARASDCDVVNFQYESGFLGIFHPGIMKQFNKPTVLTLHDSHPDNNRAVYPFTNEADVVVVHEKTSDGFIHIPQPVISSPVLNDFANYKYAVTAGFPLPWKGFELLAQATSILVKKEVLAGARFIGPRNPHCDTFSVMNTVKHFLPEADYITEWYEQSEVIRLMQECPVSVFPYADCKPGISSAVRLGLAARRPIVLSRCRQFRDLFDYEDEIEFVDGTLSPESLARAITKALESGKYPKRVLEDMSWTKAAQMYKDIYTGLIQ